MPSDRAERSLETNCTKLKRDPKPILRTSALFNQGQIIFGKGVIACKQLVGFGYREYGAFAHAAREKVTHGWA